MQRTGILVRLFRKANPNYLELHKRNNSGIHGPDFLFFSVRQIFAAARREADGDANVVVLKDQHAEAGDRKPNKDGATKPGTSQRCSWAGALRTSRGQRLRLLEVPQVRSLQSSTGNRGDGSIEVPRIQRSWFQTEFPRSKAGGRTLTSGSAWRSGISVGRKKSFFPPAER